MQTLLNFLYLLGARYVVIRLTADDEEKSKHQSTQVITCCPVPAPTMSSNFCGTFTKAAG